MILTGFLRHNDYKGYNDSCYEKESQKFKKKVEESVGLI